MQDPQGQPRREHRLLRARAARRRHSGRAGLGARCAGRGARRRRRHARGFLLDAARGVREAARPFGAVRPGVQDFLPQARLSRAADGDDVAGDDRRAGRRTSSRRPRSACSTRCSPAPRRSSARRRRSRSTRASPCRDREVLEKKDFAQMTAAEIAAAKDAIKRLVLGFDEVKTRRLAPHPHGHRIDLRRTLARQHEGRRRGDRPEVSRAARRGCRRSWRCSIFPAR